MVNFHQNIDIESPGALHDDDCTIAVNRRLNLYLVSGRSRTALTERVVELAAQVEQLEAEKEAAEFARVTDTMRHRAGRWTKRGVSCYIKEKSVPYKPQELVEGRLPCEAGVVRTRLRRYRDKKYQSFRIIDKEVRDKERKLGRYTASSTEDESLEASGEMRAAQIQ